jgi:hypothetical protein
MYICMYVGAGNLPCRSLCIGSRRWSWHTQKSSGSERTKRRTSSERLCRRLMVNMYVCMHAYENISIYMFVCIHACMYVDDFQPVEFARYSILGSDLLGWLTPLPCIMKHTYIHTYINKYIHANIFFKMLELT